MRSGVHGVGLESPRYTPGLRVWSLIEQSRSAFQSSNPIGQFIIHIYIRIRAVALTTP